MPEKSIMVSLDKIKEALNDQKEIIYDLHVCKGNMTRLLEAKYEYEDEIKSRSFFTYHFFQLKFIAVIQLAKLFSSRKNDRRSFYALKSIMCDYEYDEAMNQLLLMNKGREGDYFEEQEDIRKFFEKFITDIEVNGEVIKRVMALRDKVYAHKDPEYPTDENDPFNAKIGIRPSEIASLVDLATKGFSMLYGKLLDITVFFDSLQELSIDSALRDISDLWIIEAEKLKRFREQS